MKRIRNKCKLRSSGAEGDQHSRTPAAADGSDIDQRLGQQLGDGEADRIRDVDLVARMDDPIQSIVVSITN